MPTAVDGTYFSKGNRHYRAAPFSNNNLIVFLNHNQSYDWDMTDYNSHPNKGMVSEQEVRQNLAEIKKIREEAGGIGFEKPAPAQQAPQGNNKLPGPGSPKKSSSKLPFIIAASLILMWIIVVVVAIKPDGGKFLNLTKVYCLFLILKCDFNPN